MKTEANSKPCPECLGTDINCTHCGGTGTVPPMSDSQPPPDGPAGDPGTDQQ